MFVYLFIRLVCLFIFSFLNNCFLISDCNLISEENKSQFSRKKVKQKTFFLESISVDCLNRVQSNGWFQSMKNHPPIIAKYTQMIKLNLPVTNLVGRWWEEEKREKNGLIGGGDRWMDWIHSLLAKSGESMSNEKIK